MQWTSDELLASLQKRPSPNAYRKFMDELRSPKYKRAAMLPMAVNTETGKREMALPSIFVDMLEAAMLPGDVYQGNTSMYGEDGRTNPEVINRSADLAGMMTLGSGAIPADKNSLRMGIKAYHGSPHDFDRFDMSKIGTGEGAQAYGHGLYFAENEGVAKSYRDALSTRTIDGNPANWKKPEHIAAGWLKINKGDKEATIKYLSSIPQAYQTPETKAAVDLLKSGTSLPEVSPGRMYEVNIDADPNDFLDWDKPLSEQPEAIRRLAGWTPETEAQYKSALRSDTDALSAALEGGADYSPAKMPRPQGAMPYDTTGGAFYESSRLVPGEYSDKVAATERLRAAGIPGIKYLDAGSRGAGDGSRNYVVFDDKLISIVKKYGVAALVSAGVLSQAQGEEMKAQGYY